MRGNKLEKSHIHILESETLNRESRVTESAQKIVSSIPYNCLQYAYVYQLSRLLYSLLRLKRNMEKMRSICFTWVPISGSEEPNIYHDLGCFTRMWGFYLEGV